MQPVHICVKYECDIAMNLYVRVAGPLFSLNTCTSKQNRISPCNTGEIYAIHIVRNTNGEGVHCIIIVPI